MSPPVSKPQSLCLQCAVLLHLNRLSLPHAQPNSECTTISLCTWHNMWRAHGQPAAAQEGRTMKRGVLMSCLDLQAHSGLWPRSPVLQQCAVSQIFITQKTCHLAALRGADRPRSKIGTAQEGQMPSGGICKIALCWRLPRDKEAGFDRISGTHPSREEYDLITNDAVPLYIFLLFIAGNNAVINTSVLQIIAASLSLICKIIEGNIMKWPRKEVWFGPAPARWGCK